MRFAVLSLAAVLFTISPSAPSHESVPVDDQQIFDVGIVRGPIILGTGPPRHPGEVGIRAGHIAAIGNLDEAPRRQTIDAHGMIVAPGFIDMLGQSELTMLVDPRLPSKIYQGITTEVTGEGNSAAPLNSEMIAADRAGYQRLGIQPDWFTLRQYFGRLEHQGMGINLASYVGGHERATTGSADRAGYQRLGIQPDWFTLRQYFGRLEHQGMGINLASYVGCHERATNGL